MSAQPDKPISVLVIDDSAANRRAITRILEAAPGIRVLDRAADGEEGLKKAVALRPDVITLDLEMPRLDGFSFLRLLMARAPTPVVVLSSYGHPSDVFKALQLGAFDFVAKPAKGDRESLEAVRAELIEKIRSVPFLRKPKPARPRVTRDLPVVAVAEPQAPTVVLVGASTGGPPAVQKLLEGLAGLPVCVVVAQHMPARFTDAFAERLDQVLPFRVTEARTGDILDAGRVFIAPGGQQLDVQRTGAALTLHVGPSSPRDKHAPSIDRLFESGAAAQVPGLFAVVLTGMGSDGATGLVTLAKAGAQVWVESERTAAVPSMPSAAIATGKVTRVLALSELGASLATAIRVARGSTKKA